MKKMRISGNFTIINRDVNADVRTAKVILPDTIKGYERAKEEQLLYRKLHTKADCIEYLKKVDAYDNVKAGSRKLEDWKLLCIKNLT